MDPVAEPPLIKLPKNMTFVYDFSLLKKKWTVLRTVYHTIAGLHVTSHDGYVGGQEQKHFSPLGTKLYFHVKFFQKKILLYWPPTWPPYHVVDSL